MQTTAPFEDFGPDSATPGLLMPDGDGIHRIIREFDSYANAILNANQGAQAKSLSARFLDLVERTRDRHAAAANGTNRTQLLVRVVEDPVTRFEVAANLSFVNVPVAAADWRVGGMLNSSTDFAALLAAAADATREIPTENMERVKVTMRETLGLDENFEVWLLSPEPLEENVTAEGEDEKKKMEQEGLFKGLLGRLIHDDAQLRRELVLPPLPMEQTGPDEDDEIRAQAAVSGDAEQGVSVGEDEEGEDGEDGGSSSSSREGKNSTVMQRVPSEHAAICSACTGVLPPRADCVTAVPKACLVAVMDRVQPPQFCSLCLSAVVNIHEPNDSCIVGLNAWHRASCITDKEREAMTATDAAAQQEHAEGAFASSSVSAALRLPQKPSWLQTWEHNWDALRQQQWWDAQRKRFRPTVWALVTRLQQFGIYTSLTPMQVEKAATSSSSSAMDEQAAVAYTAPNNAEGLCGRDVPPDYEPNTDLLLCFVPPAATRNRGERRQLTAHRPSTAPIEFKRRSQTSDSNNGVKRRVGKPPTRPPR